MNDEEIRKSLAAMYGAIALIRYDAMRLARLFPEYWGIVRRCDNLMFSMEKFIK